MESLSLTLIQKDIFWEAPERNINSIKTMLQNLKYSSDLIILPEMFNTGFTKNSALAENIDGITVSFMKEEAKKNNAVIAGTIAMKYHNDIYNMFVWVQPDDILYCFPKRHLFTPGGEHTLYKPGKEKPIFNYKGWKILPLICYDLRFPVWSKNKVNQNNELSYDLLIYTANWPTARDFHWQTLLQARAIENLCFVAGCNRTGIDGNNYSYKGNSLIIHPNGKILATGNDATQKAVHYTLSKTELISYRNSFPFWKDWDKFNIVT